MILFVSTLQNGINTQEFEVGGIWIKVSFNALIQKKINKSYSIYNRSLVRMDEILPFDSHAGKTHEKKVWNAQDCLQGKASIL